MEKVKRILSIFLVALMIMSVLPTGNMVIDASATSKTVEEAMAWCEGLRNQKVGSGQCVALIQAYYQFLGVSPVSGNGCDYATNSLPSGWTRVKGGEPQAGDILVYTGAWYGHVAIYAGGSVSYHQNMAGKYVEKKTNWAYYKSWVSNAEGGGTKSYWGYIRPDFGGSSNGAFNSNVEGKIADGATIDKTTTPTFSIAGWAYCSNNSETTVYWTIDDGAAYAANKNNRQDVVNAHGCRLDCGFDFSVPIKDLSLGTHKLSIWVSTATQSADVYCAYFTVTSSDTSDPVISNIKVTAINESGYEVTCTVTDNIGVVRVAFPTWTTYNNQDDLIWADGTLEGNTAKIWISVDTHNNEYGEYTTHIYAYDAAGNDADAGIIVNVPKFHYAVDNLAGESSSYDLSKQSTINAYGWAYNRNGSTTDCYYQIDNSEWVLFEKTERKDVTNSYADCKQEKCGFGKNISINNLADGTHTIRVILSSNGCTVEVASKIFTVTRPIFVVTFNANGGSCATSNKTVKFSGTYGTLPTPTRSGYTFDGWYTAASGGTKVTSSATVTATGNHTLYAHWTCTHSSTEVRNAKSATCTATGYTGDTYCKTCGTKTKTGSSIAAAGHKWTAATCTAAKTCSVCKTTDGAALGHSYTSKVTKAATCTAAGVKTFTCSKCNHSYTESIPATGHSWTAATCTAAKTCSVCKATDGAALGHSYTSKVTKAATCTAAGVKTFTCSKCSNSYTESIPATGHKWTAATCTAARTCSVCKATDGSALGHSYTSTVTKAATCTAAGVKTFTCPKCNHSYTESIPATGHNWTAATCTAAKTCSVCKTTDGAALGHSYTSKVTKAATCTAAGVKTFTCSKCSHSYTESIPATGHNWTAATCTAAKTCSVCKATDGAALGHNYTSTVTKAATCTAAGVKTFTCSKCSHSYTESIPATGHNWTAATCTAAKTCSVCKATDGAALGHNYTSTVTKAATCTAAGVKTFTCSKCSHSYTESIPATGHTWTAATCTAAKTCSVCKATEGTALGHNYTSKVTKAATCTAAGVKTFTCSKCSHSYTESIPATGHNWTAATCTAAKTCSVCKATDGAALGHSYTSAVTKAATCTVAGVKTFTCSKCSHSYTESIPATGHTWTAATCTAAKTCSVCKATDGAALGHNYTSTVTKAATCTAAGVKTFTCSKCSNSYTESIPATGHKWTAATCTAAKTCSVCKATDGTTLGHSYTSTVTKAATCTVAGVKTFTCSKCSHSYTESIPATGHKWTAATCTAAKTCSVCKTTDGTALGHSYTSNVTKAATCTADGVKTFTCSKCSNSYTESIPATGHTPGAAATCTTNQTCTVCDAILNAKLGHTVGNAVMENKIEATCAEDGSYNMVVYCATCGEKLSTTPYTITAPGHTPGAAATCTTNQTCTVCGTILSAKLGHTPGAAATCAEDQVCTVCGEVLTAKLGHDYESVITAPTCTADGYTTYTCSVCADSYTADEVRAVGHDYSDTVTSTPTCTEKGERTYTCENCGDVYTEEMSALGHTEETLSAVAATCTETGLTEGKQCAVCGEILVAQTETPMLGHIDESADGCCDRCNEEMTPAFVLGDVDGDGQVSSSDARAALRAAVGLDELTEMQQKAADVSKDGIVTSTDARSILRCAVGLESF